MASPLDGSRLKLKRAREHLNRLRKGTADFLDSDPYGITPEYDAKVAQQIFRMKIKRRPPIDLALTIGDCIHNARSALDQLIWQIAIWETNGNPPERISFPIFKDRPGFENWLARFATDFRPRTKTTLRGCQPYFRAYRRYDTEGLPYHFGKWLEGMDAPAFDDPLDHPLWLLHEISNEDKHRLLVIAAAVGYVTDYRTYPEITEPSAIRRMLVRKRGHVENGDVLAVFRCEVLWAPGAHVKAEPDFAFGVVFDSDGPGRGWPIISTLNAILFDVGEIIAKYTHFFRSSHSDHPQAR